MNNHDIDKPFRRGLKTVLCVPYVSKCLISLKVIWNSAVRLIIMVVKWISWSDGVAFGCTISIMDLSHFALMSEITLLRQEMYIFQLAVVDLNSQILEEVVEICAHTILDIQSENLLNTFPEKSKEELIQFIKVSNNNVATNP